MIARWRGRNTARLGPDELVQLVPAALTERIDAIVESVPVDFGGGSGRQKALSSAALIIGHDLASYLEIGVYRGRSLFPVAAVFAHLGRGTAIGIDPWDAGAATQLDLHLFPPAAATVNDFVAGLDWDGMYLDVQRRITELGLAAHCRTVRARASDISDTFPDGSIGVLHVDGNHDEGAVSADLVNYLPKVGPGGFVVLDDVSWASVEPVRRMLDREHWLWFVDEANDFAVYQLR
jgi:methyltransferase family protein